MAECTTQSGPHVDGSAIDDPSPAHSAESMIPPLPATAGGGVDGGEPALVAGMSRRSFLGWIGAVGAVVGTASVTGSPKALAYEIDRRGISLTELEQASRFLAQATFGGNRALIEEVANRGIESWLDGQLAMNAQPLLAVVEDSFEAAPEEFEDAFLFFDWAWWESALQREDMVRQRVTFALSQIFVVSRREERLFEHSELIASYHDVLQRHAFGNFRDLLLDVALHPAMGIYLSHLHNRRSDPSRNRFPDENFAREVMQLFTIGLYKLRLDGTPRRDSSGELIPTYGNAEITEMAKIFTGLTYGEEDPGVPLEFGSDYGNFVLPMRMYEPEHEPGAKRLLDGFVVPAGQSGMQDIESAVDHLFQHPNVGPFFGRLLIQRLVTSNPSSAYVRRVALVFNDDGTGTRGNLAAVVRAILLDPEARQLQRLADPTFGKVREPIVRWVQLGRTFEIDSLTGRTRHFGALGAQDEGGELTPFSQYPYFSPSVFNFYSPTHSPAGTLADAGLVAPEMEIVHSYTTVATINRIQLAVFADYYLLDYEGDDFEPVALDLSLEAEIARDDGPEALVDHLDLLMTYGTLSASTRSTILEALRSLSGAPQVQAQAALYLLLISPDYVVQR
ncbi:MAG: DUF1800 domain-containing protein [Acidobacteriota bacterium]